MYEVWNVPCEYVEHIGTEASCKRWVENVVHNGFGDPRNWIVRPRGKK